MNRCNSSWLQASYNFTAFIKRKWNKNVNGLFCTKIIFSQILYEGFHCWNLEEINGCINPQIFGLHVNILQNIEFDELDFFSMFELDFSAFCSL